MKIYNQNNSYNYELEKLCRIFLPFDKIIFTDAPDTDYVYAHTCLEKKADATYLSSSLEFFGKSANFSESVKNDAEDYDKECERVLAITLFNCFRSVTGYQPSWGILTGVRPAKLYSSLVRKGSNDYADMYFAEKFLIQHSKINVCRSTNESERKITECSSNDSFSLYISIPFCPTRCSYCSFVSHSVDKAQKLIPLYMEKLIEEIKYTAHLANVNRLKLKSVYIGGGTPTALDVNQLEVLLKTVNSNFKTENIEFTLEAGRPDTITLDKLSVIKQNGVNRISINPQTMNDAVLAAIGRPHTAQDVIDKFNLAREVGFDNINMDLIAGLPTDTYESFCDTLKRVIDLNPDSVTVHSLSLKRASSMTANGQLPDFNSGIDAAKMVDFAFENLTKNGILPYYMYRQSKTVGNLENIGYAKSGKESFYNVYIMDETHTILACGASAVTKLRQPGGSYIERIFNYKYPYEYINNFNEILSRKQRVSAFYDEYCI